MVSIIVVGVDASETALKAARRAAYLATACEAELYVATAFSVNMNEALQSVREQRDSVDISDIYRRRVEQYATQAERTASRIVDELRREHPDLKITSRAIEGKPGISLCNEAEKLGADLIVVGNKRVQGPTKILGSVARSVASHAKCDLYIVNTR